MNRAAIISAVVGLVFAALFLSACPVFAQSCGFPACEAYAAAHPKDSVGQLEKFEDSRCGVFETWPGVVSYVSERYWRRNVNVAWIYDKRMLWQQFSFCDCNSSDPPLHAQYGWSANPDGACMDGCEVERLDGNAVDVSFPDTGVTYYGGLAKTGDQCSMSAGSPSPKDHETCDMSVGICFSADGDKEYCADTENGRVCTSYPGPSCGTDSITAICAGDPPPTPPDPPVAPEGDPPTTPPPDGETTAHTSSADGEGDTQIRFWNGGGSGGGGDDDPGDGGGDDPGDGGDDPPGGGGDDPGDGGGDDDDGSGDDGGVCNPATDPDCDGSGDDGSGDDGSGGDGDDGSGDDGGACNPATDPDCDGSGDDGSGDDDSAGGGGTCNAPPTCSGDVIACAALVMQWRTWCAVADLSGLADDITAPGESDYGESHEPGDAWAGGGGDGEDDPLDQIDDSGWLGGRDCPQLPSTAIMGQTVDLSQAIPCDTWRILAVLILLGGWAQAAYIIGRAV